MPPTLLLVVRFTFERANSVNVNTQASPMANKSASKCSQLFALQVLRP